MVAVTYTMNMAIAMASIATAAPTVREAAAGLSMLSKAIAVTAKAKMARKTPKAVFVTPDRTNVRMTRGESWALASWSPTRVIAKTTPTKVSIEDAITCSNVFAVRALTMWPRSQSTGRPSRPGRETTTAMRMPASTRATGIDQNRSRTHSLRRTRRCAHGAPPGSARTCLDGMSVATMTVTLAMDLRDHLPQSGRAGRGGLLERRRGSLGAATRSVSSRAWLLHLLLRSASETASPVSFRSWPSAGRPSMPAHPSCWC